jgi:hypothetical protein
MSASSSTFHSILIGMGMLSIALSFGTSLAKSTVSCALKQGCLLTFGLSWLETCTAAVCSIAGSTLVLYTIYDFKRLLPTWKGPALAFLASVVYTVSTCAGVVLGDWMDTHTLGYSLPDFMPTAIFMAWFAVFQLFIIFDARTPWMPPFPTCLFGGLSFTCCVFGGVFYELAQSNQKISMELILDFSHVLFACNNM